MVTFSADTVRRASQIVAMVLILAFIVIAVRLNESGAREAAVSQAGRNAYVQDVRSTGEKREGCERGKLDRASIARALRAQADYLNGVLQAASVKQDVKTAARLNQQKQDASATDLESRTGKRLDCAAAFPDPPRP